MIDQAEKLRRAIDNLKRKHAATQVQMKLPVEKKTARVIAVTSGKGGVGKTNITINLAIALSEQGYRVIVLDADFGLANIDVLFGIVPKYSLLDVVKNRKSILEILSDGPMNTKFISGGSGAEDLVKLDQYQISRFIENMALLDKLADIIIVDTGAGLSENVMSFVMAADEILLVTTPEPTSITDAYALIKMVSFRDKEKKIRLIVNKAESIEEAEDVLNKLVLVAKKFLNITLLPAGYIMNDDVVVKAVKQQKPFIISFPKSHAAKNIRDITAGIVDKGSLQDTQYNLGIRGFLNRLVSFMRA